MQKPSHRNHHSVDPSGIFKVFYLDMGGFDNYLLKIPFWGRSRICKIGHENQMAIRIFKAVVPKMLNSRGNVLYSCSFLIHVILNDSFLKLVHSFSLSENNTFGRNVLKTLVKQIHNNLCVSIWAVFLKKEKELILARKINTRIQDHSMSKHHGANENSIYLLI